MKPTRKVYIANKSGHDFSAAEVYGSLTYITNGQVHKFDTNTMYRIACESLCDSSPEDYLVPAGPASLIAVSAAVFALLHKRLNILIYDVKRGDYVERQLKLDNLLN